LTHAVLAGKQVIAEQRQRRTELASNHRGVIILSAAVDGSAPFLETLR
jgi:hypothetical protein